MQRYDNNKYKIFTSYFLKGDALEDELFAGFLSHVNEPSYNKYDVYLERCTITILVRGIGTYKDNFIHKTTLKPGMIIIRPKGSIYSIERLSCGVDYLEYVINLPDNFANIFYEANVLPKESKLYKIPLDDYFLQRCISLSEILNRVNNNYLGEYILALADFLDHLYHTTNDKKEDKDAKLLLNACRILENNLDCIISFADVAKQLGCCQRKLRYLFASSLNTSPKKYRMKYKFMYAENLLINSKMTIKEISTTLGYANQQNFSRQFKDFYDITPEDFRKREVNNS